MGQNLALDESYMRGGFNFAESGERTLPPFITGAENEKTRRSRRRRGAGKKHLTAQIHVQEGTLPMRGRC
jgi:hypothetical protein